MAHVFGKDSTTDEVLGTIDLSNKRVFITGVSSGLGAETARSLAVRGAEIIGTARDTMKAQAIQAQINREARAQGGSLTIVPMDLSELRSVRSVTDELTASNQPLDLIIANAGIMATPFSLTADGFESQFATNHLGHFVLVNRLAPLLTSQGRVVVLSSGAHRFSDIDLADPNFQHTPYNAWVAYGRSKTANALFAVAFDRRFQTRGIRAASLHPGIIQTGLTRGVSAEDLQAFQDQTSSRSGESQGLAYKTIPQGAATSVWAGVMASADEIGGRYLENCHVSPVIPTGQVDETLGEGVMAYALDADSAERLWKTSEDLVHEHFTY